MSKVIFLLITIVLILSWYLTFSASRLDRLHHRVETSWEHLDALLQRRAAIAIELAHKSDLDPAMNMLLASAAFETREATIIERSDAEISLSESLKLLQADSRNSESSPASRMSSSSTAVLLEELSATTDKIKFAVNIHLEAVNAVRNLRRKLVFRIFRLAGHAPSPLKYAFEDDI
jgi:hypothetical protein